MPTGCSNDGDCHSALLTNDIVCIHGTCRCKDIPGYPECQCNEYMRPDSDENCVADFCNFNNYTGDCGGGECVKSPDQAMFICTSCGNNGNVKDECQCYDDEIMEDGVCYAKHGTTEGLIWAAVFLVIILIAILSLWLYIKYGKHDDGEDEERGVAMNIVRQEEKDTLMGDNDLQDKE